MIKSFDKWLISLFKPPVTDLQNVRIDYIKEYSILLFIGMKNDLVRYCQKYMYDEHVKNLNFEESYARVILENVEQYDRLFIYHKENIIGIIECKIQASPDCCMKEDILYVASLYISESYRRNGIGTTALQLLKDKYKMKIELDAWYGIDSKFFYEKIGMRELYRRYTI